MSIKRFVLEWLREMQFERFEPSVQACREEEQQAHDAGFDAYMTGSLFVKVANQLSVDSESSFFFLSAINERRAAQFRLVHERAAA